MHVSKEDFPFASMQKRELVKGTNIALENVELLEDATLEKNECMIETGMVCLTVVSEHSLKL